MGQQRARGHRRRRGEVSQLRQGCDAATSLGGLRRSGEFLFISIRAIRLTRVLSTGSLITQVFVSGGVANEASFWNGTDQIDSVQLVNGGDDSYPGNRPNVAQIIPPETRTGQLALNGDLHVVDKVLLPNLVNSFCRAGGFIFIFVLV